MQAPRLLLYFAHPSQRQSEINRPMFALAKQRDDLTCVDLYAEYPTFDIDIAREQQRLRDHDIIIFQFPLYWYSAPAILKEWQDLVLEYGFAYGHQGTALHGKSMLCAITAGGKEAAYQTDGYNHYPIRELLRPFEQTANLIGMNFLPPFVLFASRSAVENGSSKTHLAQWQALLSQLSRGDLDLPQNAQGLIQLPNTEHI